MKAQIVAAAGLLLALPAYGQDTIFSGSGFGTYYYDIDQVDACGTSFANQNLGPVECSLETALTLDTIDSNYIVAMNHSQLVGDMATYCGKKVVVSVNGQPSDLPLFIGDGCARCSEGSASSQTWDADGAPGLDFSYTVLNQLSSDACTDGHIDITWEIVDETLFNFDTGDSTAPQGPVSSGAAAPAPSSSSTSTTQTSTSIPAPAPTPTGAVIINPIAPAVPTTLVTLTSASSTTDPTPTVDSSAACETGAWQCNGNAMEQCLVGSWVSRVTCQGGMTCQGDASPYCAPQDFWEVPGT